MMRINTWIIGVAITVAATAAHAQATRTWVSGVGDDANPCSRTAPCKTLAGALSKTAAKGEVSVLDQTPLSPATITKSITIDGSGTHASVLSAGFNGIVVNDGGTNTIEVTLRNIAINGGGTGLDGVRFIAGKRLTLDGVFITGVTDDGIDVVTTAADSSLALRNVTIENTGNTGINIAPTAGPFWVTADNVHVNRSLTSNGVTIAGNVRAAFSDSSFDGNLAGAGIAVSGAATVTLTRVTASGNNYGVQHTGGAPSTRIHLSALVSNATNGALQGGFGTISTHSSNVVENPSGTTTASLD